LFLDNSQSFCSYNLIIRELKPTPNKPPAIAIAPIVPAPPLSGGNQHYSIYNSSKAAIIAIGLGASGGAIVTVDTVWLHLQALQGVSSQLQL